MMSALLLLALSAAVPQAGAPTAPPSRALMLEFAGQARLAGTSGSLQGAKVVARHLEAAGWRVELDEREVLLSLPRALRISIFAGSGGEAVSERRERFDPDAIPAGDVPPFNSWTASGKVRAKVVDVGYGLRADYERLAAEGVDVRGAIALARYGRAYRGVKAQRAEEFGCAGVLLFTESKTDGGERGSVWPEGPWKPDWDAQRGSILPVESSPGDPTTPGWASPRPRESGKRLSREETDARLPKILCMPIGVREARQILARLEPRGPGPVEVELEIDAPRDLRTIRNVIATLPGELASEFVIAGGHRDSWVRGANDNGGGCVALLRAAQHLGARAQDGWKPARDLKLAFWDAEEHGLIGSTEWGEAHAELLREQCLAYINCDASVGGPNLGAGGSPGMLGAIERAARRVNTLDGSKTLWDDWCARVEGGRPDLGLPGAGSDHAVFAHHLGIPVVEPGFGGAPSAGQYHASFDDFLLIERFIDPTWQCHELAGRLLAELLVELSARPHAGFRSAEAAQAFARHARDLGGESWFGTQRAQRLANSFEALARHFDDHAASETRLYRVLGREFGPAERAWFRNVLWAPDVENGYSAETFPTLRAGAKRGAGELDRELERLMDDLRALRAD
jgi:N-acetylated-alpha-linked acidic dipeptidase